jgi:hypothetical protein
MLLGMPAQLWLDEDGNTKLNPNKLVSRTFPFKRLQRVPWPELTSVHRQACAI